MPCVEKVIRKENSEAAEIPRQEGHIVLIAIARKCGYIRYSDVDLGEPYSRFSFLDLVARLQNLGMCGQGEFQTAFTLAFRLDLLCVRIEVQCRGQR